MEDLTLLLLSLVTFCVSFYFIVAQVYKSAKQIPAAKRVLLVTAHPDDETMFFGPTILNMTRRTSDTCPQLFLLCMSIGNFRNDGDTRREELYEACKVLGIPEQNITILNFTKLPDNPSVRWREEVVSEKISQIISTYDIDTVLTFDRGGVSGHANHCSLYNAMVFLSLENRIPQDVSVYTLKTVNLLLKYSSFLDVPMSFLLSKTVYIASIRDWATLIAAMKCHSSQFVWFRKLYLAFSRYCLINTYDKLSIKFTTSNVSAKVTQRAGPQRNLNHRPRTWQPEETATAAQPTETT